MNSTKYIVIRNENEDTLEHHGIKGQKWGVRNYQYEDGTLTPAGKERYANSTSELTGVNKKADRKIIEDTYNEAKYAKAASMLSKDKSYREQTKAMKRNRKVGKDRKYEEAASESKRLSEQSKKAEDKSKYFSEKYQRQIKEYFDKYGYENFNKFRQDKINGMTLKKANEFIANSGVTGWYLLAGMPAATIKTASNYKKYNDYIDNL